MKVYFFSLIISFISFMRLETRQNKNKTTPSINQIQRRHWATDHCNETLDSENDDLVPELEFAVKKISRKKKAEISYIMDPPGLNNTERDKLKYEYVD